MIPLLAGAITGVGFYAVFFCIKSHFEQQP